MNSNKHKELEEICSEIRKAPSNSAAVSVLLEKIKDIKSVLEPTNKVGNHLRQQKTKNDEYASFVIEYNSQYSVFSWNLLQSSEI